MSKRKMEKPHGDPRRAGGDVAGPGGPFDESGVVIDARDAVLLDEWNLSAILPEREGVKDRQVAMALLMQGRINKQTERSKVLYLGSLEAAASLAAELLAWATRLPSEFSLRFLAEFEQAYEAMPKGRGEQDDDPSAETG